MKSLLLNLALATLISSGAVFAQSTSEIRQNPGCKNASIPDHAVDAWLNPPTPAEFAIIHLEGDVAKKAFEAMTDVALEEYSIGEDKFLDKNGKSLSCGRWELGGGSCILHRCQIVFNNIKKGEARSE